MLSTVAQTATLSPLSVGYSLADQAVHNLFESNVYISDLTGAHG